MTQHADAGAGGPPRPPLPRPAEPDVLADPYPVLARLRDASPFAESGGALVVLGRHADCSRILRDPRASTERNRSLLGPPAEDRSRFAGWSARLAHSVQPQFGAADTAGPAAAQAARAEFAGYFRELIAQRRARPGPDLLSDLIRTEDEGARLTEDELIATCVLLLVAGHETTVSLISGAILALLRHPAQLAMLRAQPSLAAGAVEETLRYDAPVQMTARIARGGIQIGSAAAPDGAILLLLLAAAGRDPDVFADPDRYDITRGAANHLAFAAGPHFCLGAPLARLEAAIVLQAFAGRVVDPELVADGLAYKANINLRGPERLVVGFSAIEAARPGA